MRLNYYELNLLSCINEDAVENEDFSVYFSTNKTSPLLVVDYFGAPLGYVDYSGYLEKLNTGKIYISKFNIILKKGFFSVCQVYTFFQNDVDLLCIPVIDETDGLLTGAYVKENSEINSYTHISTVLAKSSLPLFAEHVNQYLVNNWASIYFNCEEEEFRGISELINNAKRLTPKDCEALTGDDIVVDLKYSNKYREALLGKRIKAACVSLNDLISASIVRLLEKTSIERGCKIIYVEGPIKEEIYNCRQKWPNLFQGYSLETSFKDADLSSRFDKNICLSENKIISNGIHLYMADEHSNYVNITNGTRRSLPEWHAPKSIHLFGSCLTYGTCVEDSETISSYLQQFLMTSLDGSAYSVKNHGVRNGKNILNDFLYILNIPIASGDYLIELNSYPEIVKKEILKYSTIYKFTDYINSHCSDGCDFLDNTFHVNGGVNRMIAAYLEEILSEIGLSRLWETSLKKSFFDRDKFLAKIDSSQLLEKGILDQYVSLLRKAKDKSKGYKRIGSVLLTANPFTLGHQYLVEQAKEKCDFLYVFVVQEDRFAYSFLDRYEMVNRAISASNVMVLPTGDLLTANFTFPEYFTKDKNGNANLDAIPELHSQIFGSIIAKELGISMRFLGEESPGSVTEKYNRYIMATLPKYGIKVDVLPRRKGKNGQVISASSARQYIEQGFMNLLKEIVPQTTIDVLLKNNIRKIPIRESLWSNSYRVNNHFYKVFNFEIPLAHKREYSASQEALKHGINTPVCYGLYKLSRTSCCVFEYVEMSPLSSDVSKDIIDLKDQLTKLFNDLKKVPWAETDTFWYDMHIKEFEYELNLIDHSEIYINYVKSLKPEVFIHGDCFTGNVGTANGEIILFDFQHACLGPDGWDKAYYSSCYNQYETECLSLSQKEKAMAECIAAIKLGRSVKKKSEDYDRRLKILNSWKGCVPDTVKLDDD